MMEQYRQVKDKHLDALLLFRFGDFYELFYDDAVTASRALDIVLTARPQGKASERVPMCGVPHHRLEFYVARLIEKGHKVAICEQMEEASAGRDLIRRDVIRVVTPGTFYDSERHEGSLATLCREGERIGLALVRLATGEFLITECVGDEELLGLLARLQPEEILLKAGDSVENLGQYRAFISQRPMEDFDSSRTWQILATHFGSTSVESFRITAPQGLIAAGALLGYLKQTQMAFLPHMQAPKLYDSEDFLHLDAQTQRNLELSENIFQNTSEGTLFSVLDRTLTRMGRRRLRHWVLHPLRVVVAIHERQNAIAELIAQPSGRAELRVLLAEILDLERLTSRLTSAAANPRDLAALRTSLAPLPRLREQLSSTRCTLLSQLREKLDPLEDVHTDIQAWLVDEPRVTAREGGIIRPGASAALDELQVLQNDANAWLTEYERGERAKTGIPNLRVSFNKIFGYYIEITKSYLRAVPPHYQRRQTLVNAERFITDELYQFEEKVLSAAERAKNLEYELFVQLRERVATQAQRLRQTAEVLGSLDVLASLAEVAVLKNWTRPELSDRDTISITEGRHPVVEALSNHFVPNDLHLDQRQSFLLLTGPNAAGKSTYARQAAILVLLAQMGSFIPAQQAVIGVVDRIFTRVGAADFLARGLSTFMVEMMETANILRHATAKSLVILDEVGRGTGSADGQAIAQAVVETLVQEIKAKTIFTTHYHALAELAERIPSMANVCLAVREEHNNVTFLYKVVSGAAQKSYGIYVAQLAGLPTSVVQRASALLAQWERLEHRAVTNRDTASTDVRLVRSMSASMENLITQLQQINPLHTTPLEALQRLAELKVLAQAAVESVSPPIERARIVPVPKKPVKI